MYSSMFWRFAAKSGCDPRGSDSLIALTLMKGLYRDMSMEQSAEKASTFLATKSVSSESQGFSVKQLPFQ